MESLIPMMMTNINVKELLGGEVTTIQFYDGDTYDLFVLSVGLHHLLCVMFDGQTGSKNFGAVTNFGRRAVQDLIGVIGANAFFLQAPIAVKEEPPKRRTKTVKKVEEDEPIELARAEIEPDPLPEPESVIEQLEPIENLDLDDLFGGDMEIDESLFDESNLEELAKNSQKDQSALDWDQAQQLGILGN